MRGTDARRARQAAAAGLCALLASTELAGKFVVPISFVHDGAGAAIIILVNGPVAFAVTALATDEPEPETESEAIAQLILDRLAGEQTAAP